MHNTYAKRALKKEISMDDGADGDTCQISTAFIGYNNIL